MSSAHLRNEFIRCHCAQAEEGRGANKISATPRFVAKDVSAIA
jgi:hypothetical protein